MKLSRFWLCSSIVVALAACSAPGTQVPDAKLGLETQSGANFGVKSVVSAPLSVNAGGFILYNRNAVGFDLKATATGYGEGTGTLTLSDFFRKVYLKGTVYSVYCDGYKVIVSGSLYGGTPGTFTCEVSALGGPGKDTFSITTSYGYSASGTLTAGSVKTYGVCPTPYPTATPTVAPTATPTVEPTATPTVTPTATPTVTPTATPTVTPTATPTPCIETCSTSATGTFALNPGQGQTGDFAWSLTGPENGTVTGTLTFGINIPGQGNNPPTRVTITLNAGATISCETVNGRDIVTVTGTGVRVGPGNSPGGTGNVTLVIAVDAGTGDDNPNLHLEYDESPGNGQDIVIDTDDNQTTIDFDTLNVTVEDCDD